MADFSNGSLDSFETFPRYQGNKYQRTSWPAGLVVTPSTAILVLTTFAATVRTPGLVTPPTRALNLVAFAPAVAISQRVVPAPATLTLTSYAPSVVLPAAGGGEAGGGVGPRFVVSRPLQRLPVRWRPEPRPVRRVPITRALRVRTFRPAIRLTAHRTVVPRPRVLWLNSQPLQITTTANQLLRPQTGRFLYGVSREFWEQNKAILLLELDPELAELDLDPLEESHARTLQSRSRAR